MHAAHAFFAIWDDHEVEDNYAGDPPDSAAHQPGPRERQRLPAPGPVRRAAQNGYKASSRRCRASVEGRRDQIYGSIQHRRRWPSFHHRPAPVPRPAGLRRRAARRRAPTRTTPRGRCSARSRRPGSRGGAEVGATWKLWGSEVMVMSLESPLARASTRTVGRLPGRAHGGPETSSAAGVQNLAALTGDIHTFFAGTAGTTGGHGHRPRGGAGVRRRLRDLTRSPGGVGRPDPDRFQQYGGPQLAFPSSRLRTSRLRHRQRQRDRSSPASCAGCRTRHARPRRLRFRRSPSFRVPPRRQEPAEDLTRAGPQLWRGRPSFTRSATSG